MRAFLALDFDAAALAILRAYVRDLRHLTWSKHIKWVGDDSLHSTTRFLGEIDGAQKDILIESLRAPSALDKPEALTITVMSPQLFPKSTRPRLVVCLIKPHPVLTALALACETAAQTIGVPAERRAFLGHVTLGRVRDSWPRRGEAGPEAGPEAGQASPLIAPSQAYPMRANALTLYQSLLKSSGAEYVPLHRWPFG